MYIVCQLHVTVYAHWSSNATSCTGHTFNTKPQNSGYSVLHEISRFCTMSAIIIILIKKTIVHLLITKLNRNIIAVTASVPSADSRAVI